MSIILRRMQKSCNYVENAGSSAIVSLAGVGDEDLRIGSYSWVAVKYASCQSHPDTAQNHRTGTVSAVRRRKPTSRRRMTAKVPLCTGMMPLRPEDGTWSKGHHAGRPPLPLLRQHGADNRCPRGVEAVLWYQMMPHIMITMGPLFSAKGIISGIILRLFYS